MWTADLSDAARALRCLPDEQREALILVGADGFSYAEAADICRCATGTVKSRATRARRTLAKILDGDDILLSADRPEKGSAADDILAQLDELSSVTKERSQRPGAAANVRAARDPGR